jgi:dihydroorotate dehydrogenase electron transfer subunit
MKRRKSIDNPQEAPIRQLTARVLDNRPVSRRAYRLDLVMPASDPVQIQPGQFFMIRTSPGFDPLLRRPFSVFGFRPVGEQGESRLSILYQVVGRGTELMTGWNKGQPVHMVGPLGTGFTVPESARHVLMMAGGIGIAPLFGLAEWVLREAEGVHVRICVGGRSSEDVLMTHELSVLGAQVEVTTEDGSMGMKGLVTDWFKEKASHLAREGNTMVYACGPLAMLVAVSTLTHRLALPCQVSIEARMACGVGSCLGCAVKTREKGYQLVCKAGPVFDVMDIDWENTRPLV